MAIDLKDYRAFDASALTSDDLTGRGSSPDSAGLAMEFVDRMKTAVADQGKGLLPEALALAAGFASSSVSDSIARQQEIIAELVNKTGLSPDLAKDWSTTSPLASGLVPFDLKAPSQKLFPVLSPLRNMLPRTQGQGTVGRAKQITAISGSGQGVGITTPFFGSTDTNTFGSLALRRPAKIAYNSIDYTVNYKLQGLSDLVEWQAFWAGQGFEDVRALSNTVLLKAFTLAEENALLAGRGTDSGLSGAYAAPTITVAAATASGTFQGQTVTALTNATYFVKVTPLGLFGDGAVSNEASQATVAQVVNVNVTVDTPGALGYKVYASTTTNTEKFIGQTGYGGTTCFVLHGGNYVTTGATVPAAADSSANAYDGICSTLGIAGKAGFYRRTNAALSAALGDIQDGFYQLWNTNKANPDEIWANGSDRRDIGDLIANTTSTLAYRVDLAQSMGTAGVVVASIMNETTGKETKLTVHPWLPQGNMPILSYSLPFANSEVPNVFEVRNVQDYFSVQWPQIQATFDASIFVYGALMFFAPGFCGFLQGVKPQHP